MSGAAGSVKGRFFSPSVYHRHVMDSLKPELAFRRGPVGLWQRRFRKRLLEAMGGLPAGRREPLRVRSVWKRDHPFGRIEKILFTAEPRADVPAYVCLPRDAQPPYTFMICLQGHSTGMHISIGADREDEITPLPVEGDRDFAVGCLRRGVAALCIEQRSLGERRELVQKQVSSHGCHDAAMQALMLGRTLLGERVFDVDRGIDYLESRGDANLKRIGVMGNSGGGVTTLYAAALLPRVAFAMPSCGFCTLRDSFMSIYHCSDNYVPGLAKLGDMADVLGLFAPKPVVVVAGREDNIFPINGVRKAFQDLQKIYRSSGAPGRCRLVVGKEGHRFYAQEAWQALAELVKLPKTGKA
jgi:dienelactone hydrolase